MAHIDADDILELIDDEDILRYLKGQGATIDTSSNDLPSWEALNEIYNRDGADGVIAIVANAFHYATGKEMK